MMAVAYASFAMFAMLIEAAFGWGDGQVRRRAVNILLGSCGFAIAYATVATLPVPSIQKLIDLRPWTSPMGLASAVLIQIILYDLLYWIWHFAQHHVPLLWRIHRLHHSDAAFDATTYLRQHPLEATLQIVLLGAPLSWILTIPPAASLLAGFVYAALDFWNHLGLRVSLGPLTRIVPGPQLHRHHHALDQGLSAGNYAAFVPAWDILFGTFVMPEKGVFPLVGLWKNDGVYDKTPSLNMASARESRRTCSEVFG